MTVKGIIKRIKQFPLESAISSFSAFHIAVLIAVIYFNVQMQNSDIQSVTVYKKYNSEYGIQAVILGVILFFLIMLLLHILFFFGVLKKKPTKNAFIRTYITEMEIAYWNCVLQVNVISFYPRYQIIRINTQDLTVYKQLLSDIRMKGAILCGIAMILLYLPNLAYFMKRRKNESLVKILRGNS